MRIGGVVRGVVSAALLAGVIGSGLGLVPPSDPHGIVRDAFRLGPAHGVRFTPNARNIALRTHADGPLLLFLPATRAVPSDYRAFLDTAAGVGYHVLALDYWNRGRSVARTCEHDAACYSDLQANRFDGSHPTRFSAVTPGNSILARLREALRTLRGRDPHGGWAGFLRGDRVVWSRVVLAGHSQGGGESAFIAHGHDVQGVLMFGSPVESDRGVAAAWMAHPGVTPLARYYALDSRDDMFASRIAGSWRALRLPGTPHAFDARPPRVLPHQLVTTRPLGDQRLSHSRFITDAGPLGPRGAPVFRPVWAAMLQAVRTTPTAGP